MKKVNENLIITLFRQLNEQHIEIWLSEQGWLEYEILLQEQQRQDEKAG